MIEQVQLVEICDLIAGQSPPSSSYNQDEDGVPFFQGKADFGEIYPRVRYWCTEPKKMSIPDDILFSVRAPVGPTNINNIEACLGRGLCAIRCTDKVIQKYLLHYLRANEHKIAALGTGSTFKAITVKELKGIKIPLPSLEEQKQIAAILDAADELRQKDKALIAKYDELTQSLFLDMFGDPVTNPKGWDVRELRDLVSKLGDGLHGTPIYDQAGEYFFVNGNNLNHGYIEINERTKRVSRDEYLKHRKDLTSSTMFVSINGTIGKVAFYNDEQIMLGKSACYFNVIQENIDKIYLFNLIDSPYFIKYANSKSTGSTIQNVSLKTMRELPVILPPMTLQNQFAEQVQSIESQKILAQESLKKSECLFNSLLQKAFKGELTN